MNERAASSMAGANLKVNSVRLAVIPLPRGGERLAYELTAEYGGMLYRVYVDAHDGAELRIFRLAGAEQGRLVM